MPTPLVREDLYEYRVKRIFNEIRREHKESESDMGLEEWCYKNSAIIGKLFLEDVDSYIGFPEEE
jgi:hypothetical protein